MARAPFQVSIRGTVTDNGVQTNVPDRSYCAEDVAGPPRRKKPQGWVEPLPYYFDRWRYDRHVGRISYDWRPYYDPNWTNNRSVEGVVGAAYGAFNSLNTFNDIYSAYGVPLSMRDRALIKARLAMKDQNVDLGVAFAERNQTARLIGDTASKIARSYRSLRRGRWRDAIRQLGGNSRGKPRGSSVTSQWLEMQYGWKPLLSDVYGSLDALAKRDASDWRVTGKGSSKRKLDDEKYVGGNFDWGLGKVRGWKGCYVRIDAIPDNEPIRSLSALGITNPLLIGWELVPFSFVVDWFAPVGDYISSLDAMLGYGPTWCSITEFEKVQLSHTLESWEGESGPFINRYTLEGSGSAEYVHLDRAVTQDVPLPVLPPLKDPLSLGHMANGLSLLAQAFGRR